MKTKKLIQLMIVTICIFCMTISPMSVLAVDCSQLEAIESDNPENIEAIEGTTKVTGEATEVTEDIVEVGDEEKLTSENASIEIESGTEDAPDGLDSSESARMFLEEPDSDDEIDITKYAGGIVIDSSNRLEYNGKIITGTAQAGANLIIKGVEVELTIKNLTIDRSQEGSNNVRCDAIDLQEGATLELTLEGSNKLAGNNSYGGAGICVEDINKLIITENSNGTLEAVGGDGHGGAAGIGAGNCGYNYNGQEPDRMPALGTIEIHGGTINACGGITREMGNIVMGCAGIGCSGYGKCDTGSIIICGGNVTATGGVRVRRD